MATTNEAAKTIGTKLNHGETAIANLTSIGEIGIESEEIDVTDLDSAGGYKEYAAGAKDAGEVSLAGNIKDWAIVEEMYSLAESQTVEDWSVEYPSGATWSFSGFVKSFKDGEKTPDALATFSATIRVSGKPTFTAPTT
jgi:predicted secreted protein